MDPIQMEQRCPGSIPFGPALLIDHRLTFTYDSASWAGGVGDIRPSPGDRVWGVLWDLTDPHFEALDLYEGVAQGIYARAMCAVQHEQVVVDAVVYRALSEDFKAPSARYLRTLIRGAKAFGLPGDYVEELRDLLPVKGTTER